jgi:hypothetical protein
VTYEGLQDWLQMAWRQSVARRQGLRRHRPAPRALSAMSMTAVMAKTPLRGRSGMNHLRVEGMNVERYYNTFKASDLLGWPFPLPCP